MSKRTEVLDDDRARELIEKSLVSLGLKLATVTVRREHGAITFEVLSGDRTCSEAIADEAWDDCTLGHRWILGQTIARFFRAMASA